MYVKQGPWIACRENVDVAHARDLDGILEVVPRPDLIQLPNYYIYLKLMVDGPPSAPFSAGTLPPASQTDEKRNKANSEKPDPLALAHRL